MCEGLGYPLVNQILPTCWRFDRHAQFHLQLGPWRPAAQTLLGDNIQKPFGTVGSFQIAQDLGQDVIGFPCLRAAGRHHAVHFLHIGCMIMLESEAGNHVQCWVVCNQCLAALLHPFSALKHNDTSLRVFTLPVVRVVHLILQPGMSTKPVRGDESTAHEFGRLLCGRELFHQFIITGDVRTVT